MRLIDAIELIKTAPFTKCCGGLDDYTEGYLDCAVDARTAILKAPDIDAIPVVRCRECKHYKEFRTKRNKQIMRFCYRMGKHDMEYPVKPDDFCSYGERMADNG